MLVSPHQSADYSLMERKYIISPEYSQHYWPSLFGQIGLVSQFVLHKRCDSQPASSAGFRWIINMLHIREDMFHFIVNMLRHLVGIP